ncbi:uncharacterized protein LOC134272312 [Saccostrea cucullata]|uniref:uncharacterized protein LOC134272312 n=1 Tax=Saccostrea cuccullata TaxID=36930 RepID=UPI002ED48514
MAANTTQKHPLGSPQKHIEMCESHDLPIDMICEDCDEYICGQCAKTNHRDHDWKTITAAANQRRKGLLTLLKKIKNEDLHEVDEKIKKMSKQITENKEICDSEIENLQTHCDQIITRLTEIKKRHEKKMKDNLIKKNDQVNHMKTELEKKKKEILNTAQFIEENNSTMSDYSLIDNHRDLTKMLSRLEVYKTIYGHSVRFIRGEIKEERLESLVGKTLNLDNIGVSQKDSFQYGEKTIFSLETFSENQCYINELNSKYIEKVNQQGTKEGIFFIFPQDMCVADNSYIYFTDSNNKSISCLSPSGSVSTVIGSAPLEPGGICQSLDGGLLVTMIDNESDLYKLDSHSRRLMRHVTVTGDVIREYEYQEDGHTRLFTVPRRVTQNSNSDICVVNSTGENTTDLIIMSSSGRMKVVYQGQNLTKNFIPTDVVCDSLCYILVTDCNNKKIHLLSPDGEFLMFLPTENKGRPYCLSLRKSILWVGYFGGFVKVFKYRMLL